MYFSSSQTSRLLPMPPGPVIETSRARRSRPDRVELLLELPQLLVAADERRLERVRASVAAALRDDAERLPRRDGAGLALERVVADGLEHDRRLRRAPGGLADQHGARLGDALQPGRGVDEVAGHHALVGGAQRDRRLAGQQPGAGLEVRDAGC